MENNFQYGKRMGLRILQRAGALVILLIVALAGVLPQAGLATNVFLTSSTSWTVPSDWDSTNNTIEVIGAGGGGATSVTINPTGGGGGGGAYSQVSNITLTPGASVTYAIGAAGAIATAGGDTYFNGASCGAASVCAKGGSGASGVTGGAGGVASSGVGTLKYSGGAGGNGRAGSVTNGGGGGGGAGSPNGDGKAGGSPATSSGSGGGGGGSGGGTVGGNSTASPQNGGAGGNNFYGTGGGGGGTAVTTASAGKAGGGGGGGGYDGNTSTVAGAGGPGTDWDQTHGSGGGGGGGSAQNSSAVCRAPGVGGAYGGGGGGGGGGSGGPSCNGAVGAAGLIVITYGSAHTQIRLTVSTKFLGNLGITQTIAKGSGTFVIDHPLDPANKLLYHSFVESPDVKNLYDGIATLDKNGEVIIMLPDYFDALNKDFRYQFFPLDQADPNLYLKTGADDSKNQFTLAGGTAGNRISWQVTGIRHDKFILEHPVIVEVPKTTTTIVKRGEYLFDGYVQ